MHRSDIIGGVRRDLRYALRQLRERRGFAVVAILTLALSIGANTAIFSAVDAVLLRPLDVPDLDRIVVVQDNLPPLGLLETPMGPGEARDLMERGDLFQAAAGWAGQNPTLTGTGEPGRLHSTRTFGRFFEVFGQHPLLGRFYRPEESEPERHRVAVLSYGLWQELGGDSSVLGRTLTLNDESFEIIGVAAPELRYPRATQLWTPFPLTERALSWQQRLSLYVTFVGKLRSGVTQEALAEQLLVEGDRWSERFPQVYGTERNKFMTAQPLVTELAGQLRPVLLVLVGAVAFVLLIACANVASLQPVHGMARAKELAVRAALGAGRGTLVRQLLIENVVLAVVGGVLGVLVGQALLQLVIRNAAAHVPALEVARLSGTVLLVTAAVTLGAAFAFGVLPSLRATRVDLQTALKDVGRAASAGREKHRWLQSAVVGQVALTLVLLLGSSLMVRSLARLLAQDPGFRSAQVTTARVTVGGERYATGTARTTFFQALLERLEATPGVQSAGIISELPFGPSSNSSPFEIIGRRAREGDPVRHANMHSANAEYFRALGVPLLRGRMFEAADAKGTPIVALIDAQLAREFFPNEDPIGQQISQGNPATIVGVVGTVAQANLGEPPKATVYYHHVQYDWWSTFYVVVRSALPPPAAAGALRSVVRDVDADVPVYDLRSMDDRIASSLATRRLGMTVMSGFAALALMLAIFGLYGTISYGVTQRRHEFGIRLALGAQSSDVRAMVVRQGAALAITGVVLGAIAALGATRALADLLYQVSPRDPLTYAAAALALTAVAVVASWFPAHRATRVDPADALRST